MLKRLPIAALLFVLLFNVYGVSASPPSAAAPPNVVVIIADDLQSLRSG